MATLAREGSAFIGRRDILAALSARRSAAAAKRGSIVLVSGEAGIGKTRVLQEFAATMTHGRGRAYWVRCSQFDADSVKLPDGIGSDASRLCTLFVEDAQWAPCELLGRLIEIGRYIHQRRLLLVVSYRPADLERDAQRTMLLGQLARIPGIGVIELCALDSEEVRALIQSICGERNGTVAEVVERVARRSGGNPLLVRELTLGALRPPNDGACDPTLPLSVRGLVTEWLEPFSEMERNVLKHAALFPRGFAADDVAELVGARDAVASALHRARALHLVAERDRANARYEFRHPVVAEYLAAGFLAHEARRMHERIAQKLEASGHAEDRAEELAEHWQAAGNDEMSGMYAEKAGDRAYAVGSFVGAAAWYQRAAASARRMHRDARHVYEKLAFSLFFSGNAIASHAALRSAAVGFELTGDTDRAASLLLQDALIAQHESDLPAAFSRLDAVARLKLPATSQHYAQAVAAFLLALQQESGPALELLADFPYRDPATDAAALAQYWAVVGYIAAQRCDPAAFLTAYEQCLELARRSGDVARLAEVESDFAIASVQFAQNAPTEWLGRTIAMAQEHGLTWIESYTRAFAAVDDFVRGRLSSAREHLRALVALACHMPMTVVARTYAGIAVGRALGDDDLIAQCVRSELLEMAFGTRIPSVFARTAGPYAQWLADRGRTEEARAILRRCVTGLRSAYATFLTMPVVAAHADAEDVATARRLLEAAAANRDDLIAGATLPFFDALWNQRIGESEVSRKLAAVARERYHAIGWTTLEAQACELAGDRGDAVRLYRQSGNLRELRRLEFVGDVAQETDRDQILSGRERSIAALVRSGKSNRAIATALSLSEKTVERHLTSIFQKLGFRSRTQLLASTLELGDVTSQARR